MGIVLILVSAVAGYCLLKQFSKIDKPLILFSGATVIGCILCGTLLYLVDLLLAKNFGDFFNSNFLVLAAAGGYIFHISKRLRLTDEARSDLLALRNDRAAVWCLFLVVIFSAYLNWHSLNVTSRGDILVANGAWSDLMYHVSYIRTVALGNNVPIQYPYFANEPIRYHFLFDYFTGKVSQLGLDAVQALNIMSTLGLVSLLMLVFEFGRQLFKRTLTAVLGILFLVFHSSLSVFPWLKENFNGNILQSILQKGGWLAGTDFEVWGLFNLNVFVNQRHFAFGLAALVLLVIVLVKFTAESEIDDSSPNELSLSNVKAWVLDYGNVKVPLFWAVIIGCLPFWNALFAAIAVMFVLAFALFNYKNKNLLLGLLLTAIVASIIVYPQLMLFKAGASALKDYPRFHFGYALDHPSLIGFITFYFKVFGLKVPLIAAALFLVERRLRVYALILLIPFLIANLFQLSSVLYDNNKLIIASLVFMNCYAAYGIVYLLEKRSLAARVSAIVLSVLITLAGVVDFFAARNLKQTAIADQTSSLKWWTVQHTKPRSVFLTNTSIPFADNAVSAVTLAGRYLYVVSNCVASSCSVDPRLDTARRIYSFAGGMEQVKSLLQAEGIDYVLVDEHVRNNRELGLNERAFIENFKMVYKEEGLSVFALP